MVKTIKQTVQYEAPIIQSREISVQKCLATSDPYQTGTENSGSTTGAWEEDE